MTEPAFTPAVHFELEFKSDYRQLLGHPGHPAQVMYASALLAVFGLPLNTPVRLSIRFTDRNQLIAVNGPVAHEASPAEVGAALNAAGAIVATTFVLPTRVITDLNGEAARA